MSASLGCRSTIATTSRLWNTASAEALRSRIDGLMTRMSGPTISPAAMPIHLSSCGGFPTTAPGYTGFRRRVTVRTLKTGNISASE